MLEIPTDLKSKLVLKHVNLTRHPQIDAAKYNAISPVTLELLKKIKVEVETRGDNISIASQCTNSSLNVLNNDTILIFINKINVDLAKFYTRFRDINFVDILF